MNTTYMEHEKLLENIYEYLKSSLKESRFQHTMGVRSLALEMAEKEGVDLQKTEVAALLHDMAKNFPPEVTNMYVRRLDLGDKYRDNPNLAHSKIAAALATIHFGIKDKDIINAISFHTTARAGMSKLEKIIFLADAIEPGRNYPGIDEIRAEANVSLDRGCMKMLLETILFLREKQVFIDTDTTDAYEYFKENINE